MSKELLNNLIETTIREGASDLHLLVGRHPMIRVAGALIPFVKKALLTASDLSSFTEEILSPNDRKLFLQNKELDFSYNFRDEARFRCNAYFEKGNSAIALRLIPRKVPTLEELNLPRALEQFTKKRQGFFLVVGPMGHGKSTTLASLINIINSTRSEHILTIEDPIEYMYEEKLSVIDQREVRIDTKDFHTALVSMFREDVNVALIGEMRDQETISSAVTAAETGHLIFSTLHTNSAAQSIDRIIDIFPPGQQEQIRLQLAATLTGVFSQRLVPRISGGLIPAYELLISNYAVANLIREKRTHEINTFIETGLEQGMTDMNRSLADLVRRGEITPENAFAYSPNPRIMDRLL
ncbi:MAG: type IV pili twitching motility protein PilT [Candidatus Taylorbacteria bacterium RIFCSPHIGHO2_02_49_25]|uniref:Type IV pili twitching motility protein PilT n=1 Tax=Candidatus Taylorbacteria bacterium RIFCSPHIGHO2_02_49_25 TaxID=1802305 RepID=A0A1G2MDG7_9BACT|nr:MAG: type IV pili twitching motility protein PilT [Candidatus Taylorbacteria bacterium RIFCSPHIGHO2_01_FULL_49_60]OHA21764.1 MAG: type IV pili twitching motility protein PilT [Candidatus Taylorbacteria bacterium RIFCSPHIGHO2_02_49_25]OHA35462.1 MAG: type IV pili twitching motility protein PilT [Candidatus Taylorbacteria bacterium RIFCSPLOWO2_02_50_13]OHA37083.1 MAG: type IV pili twitching motility protein PilT [Candidatus Taylorbacteria bacterium RIFCSPLOWO2_01_FULL_50_130]OHA40295.1 MAG: ty